MFTQLPLPCLLEALDEQKNIYIKPTTFKKKKKKNRTGFQGTFVQILGTHPVHPLCSDTQLLVKFLSVNNSAPKWKI